MKIKTFCLRCNKSLNGYKTVGDTHITKENLSDWRTVSRTILTTLNLIERTIEEVSKT